MWGTEAWIVLLSGLGTFALRWLPWRQARRRADRRLGRPHASGWLEQALVGVGPAAITALLLVSLWGLVQGAEAPVWSPVLAAVGGLATVVLVRRIVGGMAWPTLLGALAYGGMAQWLGG